MLIKIAISKESHNASFAKDLAMLKISEISKEVTKQNVLEKMKMVIVIYIMLVNQRLVTKIMFGFESSSSKNGKWTNMKN